MVAGKRSDGKGAKGGKGSKASAKGWAEKDGSKGGYKGKDGGKGKSWGKESAYVAAKDSEDDAAAPAARVREEGGAPERPRRTGDRAPLECKGDHCEVKKHSEMGCAVVTLESVAARDAVMRLTMSRTPDPEDGREKRPEISIEDTKVQLRAHVDKSDKTEIMTDIFIAWGRKVEKVSPLPPEDIARAFDDLFREAQAVLGQDTEAATASIKSMLAAMPQTSCRAPPPPPPQMPAGVAAAAGPLPMGLPFGAGFPGQAPAGPGQQPPQVPPQAAAAQQYAAMMAAMQQQAAMHQAQQAAMQQAAAQQAALQQATFQAAASQALPEAPRQADTPAAADGAGPPPETPPRRGPGMRADAPEFSLTPEVPEVPAFGEPTRRQFQIFDPSTKKPIEAPTALHAGDFERPKKADRKAMAIIDPSSGDAIRALDFDLPKETRSFTITDPQSGTAIKV